MLKSSGKPLCLFTREQTVDVDLSHDEREKKQADRTGDISPRAHTKLHPSFLTSGEKAEEKFPYRGEDNY
jgi:hypothetical protein